nr:uncharacterized protein LOC109992336 [Labrus bergylta]
MTYNSVSVPSVKVENNCLSISGHGSFSNALGPTPISAVLHFDCTAQITLHQVEGHSNQATGSDIQSSEPIMDPMIKFPELRFPGPDMNGPGMLNTRKVDFQQPNSDSIIPGTSMQGFGMRGSVQDNESSSMHGLNTKEKGQSSHLRHSETEMRRHMPIAAATNLDKGRSGIQNQMRDPETSEASPSLRFSERESGRSNMSCTEQDSKGSREHLNRPKSNVNSEIGMHGTDMREPETILKNIGELSPNRRESDMQLRNPQGQWLEERNEQMIQGNRGPMKNNTNSDWRGPGPDMSGQTGQDKGQSLHMRGPDWNDPGTDRRDEWRGPERRGSGPVRVGQFMRDEWRVRPDWRGQNRDPGA